MLVFISYTHADGSIVEQIGQRLNAAGLSFFQDKKDIPWGGRISSEVQRNLEKANGVVVVISPRSLESNWVPYEIGYATALRKPVLPFVTEAGLDLPSYLSDIRYITDLQEIEVFIGQVETTGAAVALTKSGDLPEAVLAAQVLGSLPHSIEPLLASIRDDLKSDSSGLVLDFVVLTHDRISYAYEKKHFSYFEDEVENLRLAVDRLVDHGLVEFLRDYRSVMRTYRITPAFAAALHGQAED